MEQSDHSLHCLPNCHNFFYTFQYARLSKLLSKLFGVDIVLTELVLLAYGTSLAAVEESWSPVQTK